MIQKLLYTLTFLFLTSSFFAQVKVQKDILGNILNPYVRVLPIQILDEEIPADIVEKFKADFTYGFKYNRSYGALLPKNKNDKITAAKGQTEQPQIPASYLVQVQVNNYYVFEKKKTVSYVKTHARENLAISIRNKKRKEGEPKEPKIEDELIETIVPVKDCYINYTITFIDVSNNSIYDRKNIGMYSTQNSKFFKKRYSSSSSQNRAVRKMNNFKTSFEALETQIKNNILNLKPFQWVAIIEDIPSGKKRAKVVAIPEKGLSFSKNKKYYIYIQKKQYDINGKTFRSFERIGETRFVKSGRFGYADFKLVFTGKKTKYHVAYLGNKVVAKHFKKGETLYLTSLIL